MKLQPTSAKVFGFVSILAAALSVSACDCLDEQCEEDTDSDSTIIIDGRPIPDDGQPDNGTSPKVPSREVHYRYIPNHLHGSAQSCERTESTYTYRYYGYNATEYRYYCYQNDKQRWHNSCQSDGCQEIPVFVHYMLDKDLGENLDVQVEAFRDKTFQGQPAATVEIQGFHAKAAEWAETSLFLDPGEYYLRAFLTTRDQERIPYAFQGMHLVAETPIGVYGALSDPKLIRVGASGQDVGEPVHIMLEKLFQEPGTEPPTNARLRLKLSLDDVDRVERGDKVRIRLYDADAIASGVFLEFQPVYDFSMLADLFNVAGDEGHAEYVTENLAIGSYGVFTFLDEDDNGFYDDGEPSALHQVGGLAHLVQAQQDRTKTLELKMSVD